MTQNVTATSNGLDPDVLSTEHNLTTEVDQY